MVSSRSAAISLKGSSSSLIACSADFSEIPLFRQQFFMVNSDTSDRTDCNSYIAYNSEVCGSFFFMPTARISRFMIFLRYFPFRERITPWCIGWGFDVVFRGRNTSSMAFNPSTIGCAGQLSTMRTILPFSFSNFLSSSFTHSQKRKLLIQLFGCAR